MGADGVAQVARTIAVINNKGGVGKTTASKALCEGMAERGYNVLLIDMDAQANITTWVKAEASPDALTVFNLLEKPKMPLSDCVQFMDGCDIIVFTAGVGENQPSLREEVCKKLTYLGVEIDVEKNKNLRGKEALISTPESKVAVCVIPTDEELMIASDTMALL